MEAQGGEEQAKGEDRQEKEGGRLCKKQCDGL